MNGLSRRKFLAASGAGAVAVGAVSVPLTMSSTSEADGAALNHEAPLEAVPLLLSVDDLQAGRISVMHGEREISVTDVDLANRIASIARTGV